MTFEGKSVLVTGAGGSIGSKICERVINSDANKLTMVSLTESGLYNIEKHLRTWRHGTKLVSVLGSVTNQCLMRRALEGVDIVVHAAAHKHVPMCEQNACEAIWNNVFGTETLALEARAAGVSQFCLISSDKAVQPASVMGATKRAAELIVAQMGSGFFVVRFGNVLDSAGSVLPLWREQIEKGGPITLTDERCERYFMSIPDAVALIAGVIGMEPTGGTFVLDMGKPRLMVDVAHDLMRTMGKTVAIKCVGLRPGEKLTEELHYGGSLVQTKIPGVHRVEELGHSPYALSAMGDLEGAVQECDARKAKEMLWSMVER